MKIKSLLLVSVIALMVVGSVAQAGLVGYWKFDGDPNDASGNGHNGVANNATYTDGYINQCLSLNGSSTYVDFGDAKNGTGPSLGGQTDFTVAAWIKTTATSQGVIIQQRDHDGNGWYGQYQFRMNANGTLAFFMYDAWHGYAFNFHTSQTVNDGQWHHVLAMRQKPYAYIYIDGSLAARNYKKGTFNLQNYISTAVGCDIRDSNKYFKGKIDEVYLYNNAFTTNEIIEMAGDMKALLVSPADMEENVFVDSSIQWDAPTSFTPLGYNVYLGRADDPNWDLAPVLADTTATSYTPPAHLDYNAKYLWRIDSIDPNNGSPVTRPGALWSFTTIPPDPVVVSGPDSATVAAGDSATFTVEALQGEFYTWYKSDDYATDTPTDDVVVQATSTSNTLTVSNVQLADEGYYYCVLTNSIPGSGPVTSPLAHLLTKRLIADWQFDGNLNDETGAWPGTSIQDPNYEMGIDGKAIRFIRGEKNRIVTIPGSNQFFNFYPQGLTVTFWYKPDNYGGVGGFEGLVSKNPDWDTYDEAYYYAQGYAGRISGHGLAPGGRLDDGNWHMVTMTYDADTQTMKVYKEGVFSKQAQFVANPGTGAILLFGAQKTNGKWGYSGLIDDTKIYDYPLTPIQIASLYAETTHTSFCFSVVPADLNGDCVVDMQDFAILASDWMVCTRVPTTLCP